MNMTTTTIKRVRHTPRVNASVGKKWVIRATQANSVRPRCPTSRSNAVRVSSDVKLHLPKLRVARLASMQTAQVRRTSARVQAHAEATYVMVKPDGVQRGLVGEIISRFERKGYVLKGLKMCTCEKQLAEEHYKELADKPFFSKLVDYIISGPVVCMIWEGTDVVKASRKIIGATNPTDAEPGTIRGDFGVEVGRNIVHGSDSVENSEREIGLWFGAEGMVQWESTMAPWIKEMV